MELPGVGVNYVLGLRLFYRAALQGAVSGGVVDGHPGLNIVAEHVKAHALALVLHGFGLHKYPLGHQIFPFKDGGNPVEHMVAGLLHVVGHHVFKGEHPRNVQVPGASNQVLLVGVFRRQLIADEVAAVVQVLAVYAVILHRLPAGGLYLANLRPLLRGHGVQPHAGHGGAAPPQLVQLAVFLKAGGGERTV